jgi:hypothetical protein
MIVPGWVIPLFATLACLYAMFRPYKQHGDFDIGPIFRLFWFIPIGFIWAAYFAVAYVMFRLTYPNT